MQTDSGQEIREGDYDSEFIKQGILRGKFEVRDKEDEKKDEKKDEDKDKGETWTSARHSNDIWVSVNGWMNHKLNIQIRQDRPGTWRDLHDNFLNDHCLIMIYYN